MPELDIFIFPSYFSGSSWTTEGCKTAISNKTHVVCQCWPYGIVTVLGKDKVYWVSRFGQDLH